MTFLDGKMSNPHPLLPLPLHGHNIDRCITVTILDYDKYYIFFPCFTVNCLVNNNNYLLTVILICLQVKEFKLVLPFFASG